MTEVVTVDVKDLIKKASLTIAENHIIQAIDDVYAIAQVYVDSTVSPLDNTILAGLEMLKSNLVDVADKIDGEDNH